MFHKQTQSTGRTVSETPDNSNNQEKGTQSMSDNSSSTPSGSNPYQRGFQQQSSAQGGYNPQVASSVTSTVSTGATGNERQLVVGNGITLSGEITSCDHLIVQGTIEAQLKGAQRLDVAESGVFYGTVDIQEATIAGRFEGDIKVDGRLVVRAGGHIVGTIAYKELSVEAGATLEGKISPLKGSSAQTSQKKGAEASAKAQSASKSSQETTSSESLPFEKREAVAAE